MNRRKVGYLPHLANVSGDRPLRDSGKRSARRVPMSVAELHGVAAAQAEHTRMLRGFVAKCDRYSNGEGIA